MRVALLAILLFTPSVLALPVPTPFGPTGVVTTDKVRYEAGDTMLITFSNPSDVPLGLPQVPCWEIRDASGQIQHVPGAVQLPTIGCADVAPGSAVTFTPAYREWSGFARGKALPPGEYNVAVPYTHGQGVLPLGLDDRDVALTPITVCTPAREGAEGVADLAFLAARC